MATESHKVVPVLLFSNLETLLFRPCMRKFNDVLFVCHILILGYIQMRDDHTLHSLLYQDHYWLDSVRLEICHFRFYFCLFLVTQFDHALDQVLNLLYLAKCYQSYFLKTIDLWFKGIYLNPFTLFFYKLSYISVKKLLRCKKSLI